MRNEKGMGSVYKMKDCKRRRSWRAVSTATRNKITVRISLAFETRQEGTRGLNRI